MIHSVPPGRTLPSANPVPDLSVIIPVYNRGTLVRHTLDSVWLASSGLRVETILIDDGSTIPLSESLANTNTPSAIIHRQENRGLLFARLAGLDLATGDYVLFLDSDDLVHPDKFTRQLAAMKTAQADVSYSDEGAVPLDDGWETAPITQITGKPATDDSTEFFVRLQPAPHNPIFRTAYLRPLVQSAWMPPAPSFNSVAEIWFYYLCAAAGPAKVVKCDGPLTLQGLHLGVRRSSHWEKLALGSLAVMQSFARHCTCDTRTLPARTALAERVFLAWRALPPDSPAAFQDRLLAVLDHLPPLPVSLCGGQAFRALASVLGLRAAARLLRRWQRPSYDKIRTLPPGEFARLADQLPRP